jgi:DNA-binding transcriptional LysR family regulator
VPPALASFRRAHPHVEIQLEEAEPSTMVSALRSGKLDLAIVYTVPGREHPFQPPLALRPLTDDPIVAVLPNDHRLAHRRSIRLAELAQDEWVAARPPNDFRTLFDELCSAAGFEPQIAIETSDPSVGVTLAAAGIGALLIPALALHANPQIKPKSIRGIPAARTICIATISGRRHPALTTLSNALTTAARAISSPS